MSETVTPDQNSKSEPVLQTEVHDADTMRCDGYVTDVSNDVNLDKVTSSENDAEEPDDILPFQRLAVELKEGDEDASPSPATNCQLVLNDQPVENTNTIESSEDTVLSAEDFAAQPFENTDLLQQCASVNGNSAQDASSILLTAGTNITPEIEDDAAVDFDTSMYFQQQMEDQQKNVKTYLEDFLLSSGPSSSVVAHDSDSASNEEKGSPLYRFPKIVRAMEEADYSILQVLYRLLYLRNAWDTESILSQRILEFSGFNCDPNSEDFYTREVMLRTLPCEILLNIGKLLALKAPNTADFDKLKIQMVTKIMNFLHRPKRAARRSRPAPKRSVPSNQNKGTKGKSPIVLKVAPTKECNNKVPQASTSDVSSMSPIPVNPKLGHAINQSKPGPLSHKLKTSGASPEKILELESLKESIVKGKGMVPKVSVQLLGTSDIKRLICSRTPELKETDKDKETDNDEETETEEDKKTDGDIEKEKKVADQTSCNENTSKEPKIAKEKLRSFQHIISSIEGTPEELLAEIHYLLFKKTPPPEENQMKYEILEFSGFSFKGDSDEFNARVQYLNSKSESIVKDIARALYLDPKIDKQGTILNLMEFLKEPDEKYLRPTVVAPGMLSDCEVDIEGMSDIESDDSITCEVIPKRVECIDLISSGDENEKEPNKNRNLLGITIKKEPEDRPAVTQPSEPVSTEPTVRPIRRLRDFETITKIVNTHPTEYLVDIYNLLYMVPYEPPTLRKDILDFPGFDFEKGTPEYTKRKQFLDRMLYNSVRRIYNTLIHNTREVKVFSKPTMIGEIFQFLLKLPDTDTSVRLPPPKVGGITTLNLNQLNNANTKQQIDVNVMNKGITFPSQPGKLSDLKRVFQRVACFPCEYLVDVHKLLFMTDCDIKDIRNNIFGFKGFSFSPDSSEFNQRKLYLEYLTFHSLRKISSVLTTKTVDLRNSTKHELASHLTEVLKEYTDTCIEVESFEIPTTVTDTPVVSNPIPADSVVEQIVVTPIIPSYHQSSSPSPEPPACVTAVSPAPVTPPAADDNMMVSSSTPALSTQSSSTSGKNAESPSLKNLLSSSETNTARYYQPDVNTLNVEKNSKTYQSNIKIMPKSVTTLHQPVPCQPHPDIGNISPNSAFGYRPEFVLQQVPPHFGPQFIQPGMPFIQAFQQPIHIQNPYVMQQNLQHVVKTDEDQRLNLQIDVCKEDSEHGLPPKRAKMMSDSPEGNVEGVRIVDSHSLADKKEDFTPASSFHLKIRDAMTKASEDEEDCDKPLSMLLGHPNDKVLKQQICEIVENTDLQEITINGVIQKIFDMYPKFNLNYRKEFIKSALRSLLYRLGEQDMTSKSSASCNAKSSDSPDCSVSTTDPRDSPEPNQTGPHPDTNQYEKKKKNVSPPSFQQQQSS